MCASTQAGRLTDAFTKVLLPGVNIRMKSACAIIKNKLDWIDTNRVAEHKL